MNPIKTLCFALAAMSVPGNAIAQDAKACLTASEAESLIAFALPDVLQSVTDKCRPELAAGSFLVNSGPDMVARFRESADSSWPRAKTAIIKISGADPKMLEALPDEATRALFGAGLASAVGQDIKPESCSGIDRAVAALAPLPSSNIASLVTILLEMGSKGRATGGKSPPFSVCPAAGRSTASK